MPVSVDLRGVQLDYLVYSLRAQSLRSAVLNVAVGGRLLKTRNDITVVRALAGVSLNLKEGDRLGIVGHNGSGKTSLLKVIAGVYEPTKGYVGVQGRVSSMLSMSVGLDPEASGLQNIRNLMLMQLLSRREVERRLPEAVEFSELGAFIHMPFKTYSGGMMARLMFSVGTAVGGEILVLDEWLGAGDAAFQAKAEERMTRFVDTAKIVILATHSPALVERVCNKVLVLDAGHPTYYGSLEGWHGLNAAA